ncbi:hypothetical protein [Agrococcus sp. ARC_14]|uniref:hypothetical protein n=1 Tax=Agrococcus sp. ARC_14 TaxID=2919927 RepID=UPI001F060E74|nr:hypothetical protein [Agrococcus sp. ARC_14]MCH1882413.1 hypothetical protein [Agrococcus sp. ARC_14]
MSADRPTVVVQEPVGGWKRPWPQAFEMAHALPEGSWTLVGGLMVQLHAIAAGVPLTRPTTDVDAALHLETGVITFVDAAARLRAIDYLPDESQQHAYRFTRGQDVVDMMVADRLAPAHRPRYGGREVFRIAGGTQALRRTVDAAVRVGGKTIVMSVPNLHGALVLKGAAFLGDARDRHRHVAVAITLLACLEGVDGILGSLAGSDAKRLRALTRALDAPDPWADAHRDTEALARPMHEQLGAAL